LGRRRPAPRRVGFTELLLREAHPYGDDILTLDARKVGFIPPGAPNQPTLRRTKTSPASAKSLRCQREILAAGSVSHPHLVSAHDACWDSRVGSFSCWNISRESIVARPACPRSGRFPSSLVCSIAAQNAIGFGFFSTIEGWFIADVKPANLLISPRSRCGGDRQTPRPRPHLPQQETQGEELCGTPDYLPPERGHSPDAIDIRGDLYSLGCALYEVLTGRVPFPGGTWTDKLLRHRLGGADADHRASPPTWTRRLTGIIARLMARDPDDRPGSPAEVMEMLRGRLLPLN